MSYTLAQATTKVRELLNEPSASFWSDTEIQGWLQEAVLDISTKLLCVVGYDTITLVQDQYVYTTSDHSWIGTCLKPKSGIHIDSNGDVFGLQMIDLTQFGHSNHVDPDPKYYYYDSEYRAFFIHPIPDSTVASLTLKFIYSYITNDITVLKDEYQPIAFTYAVYKAKLKEKLYADAYYVLQQYMYQLNFERSDKYKLGVDAQTELQIP